MDDEIIKRTDQTIKNLEHYERNWHVFKSVVLLIAIAIVGIMVYADGQYIKQVIAQQEQQTEAQLKSQRANTTALKNYINCLLLVDPAGDVHAQEQNCLIKSQ